jgi:hypothetical protein
MLSAAEAEDDEADAVDEPRHTAEQQPILYPAMSVRDPSEAALPGSPSRSSAPPPPPTSTVVPTLLIVVSAFVLSLLISSVATLWSLLGSSVSILVAFILPSAAYIRIRRRKGWTSLRLSSCVMLAASAVIMTVMTSSVVARLTQGSGGDSTTVQG